MAERRKAEADKKSEPVGIIISRGSRAEDPPRFSAYVWGPVPAAELEVAGEMVAA